MWITSPQAQNILFGALLYSFEDIEAVIKMRDVSRNHGVALDWLFDRSNLDAKTKIKHVDTQIQLAEISNKISFTRDEWSHLFR